MSYPVRLPWLLLISAAIFSADRWTKTWVAAHIALGGAIPVVPGYSTTAILQKIRQGARASRAES